MSPGWGLGLGGGIGAGVWTNPLDGSCGMWILKVHPMSLVVGTGAGVGRGCRSRAYGQITLIIVVSHEYQKSILCV